jgi:hypothetical protein
MLVLGWRFVSIPLAALIAVCEERKYRPTGRVVGYSDTDHLC